MDLKAICVGLSHQYPLRNWRVRLSRRKEELLIADRFEELALFSF
jgi:hypothetical protein